MVLQQQHYTADDIWMMAQDEDKHFELIEGHIIQMIPTGFLHGIVTSDLTISLGQHVRSHKLGLLTAAETGYRLSDNTVIAPDIAFIQQARVPTELVENYLTIAPDLAVEVMSPSNNSSEMSRKIDLLFQHGTQLIWVVHPSTKTIDVYEKSKNGRINISFLELADSLTGGSLLPNFELALSDLFTY